MDHSPPPCRSYDSPPGVSRLQQLPHPSGFVDGLRRPELFRSTRPPRRIVLVRLMISASQWSLLPTNLAAVLSLSLQSVCLGPSSLSGTTCPPLVPSPTPPTMAPRGSALEESRGRAVGRGSRRSRMLSRRGHAVATRRSAFFAAAFVAAILPQVATAACATPPRVHTVGARARLCIHSGLDHVLEDDFRLLFRMAAEEFWALHAAVEHRLAMDEGMATLSSGSPIPTECRLALGLRILAGASYLDCMLAFGVSRSMVYAIFHQVCAPLVFVLSCLTACGPGHFRPVCILLSIPRLCGSSLAVGN